MQQQRKRKPAVCSVVRILEATGPKGGVIHVLLLRCGSWLTRRLKVGQPPPVAVFCIACHVRRQLGDKLGRPPEPSPIVPRPH